MGDTTLGLIVIVLGLLPAGVATVQLSRGKIPKFPPGLVMYSAVLVILGMAMRGAPLVVSLAEAIGKITGGQ